MKNRSRLGFSLIELSITILVIGILVIGITKGSRIIGAAKLKTAQGLTTSSPIHSMQGLYLWLEPTSEKSFDSNIKDGDLISNWYDTNSQSSNNEKFNFSQSGSARPTYKLSGMNSLPSVQFDGVNDFITNSAFKFPYANYSVFISFNMTASGLFVLFNTDSIGNGSAGLMIQISADDSIRTLHRFPYSAGGGNSFTSSVGQFNSGKNYIFSFLRNLDNGSSISRLNKNIVINQTATIAAFDGTNVAFKIGALVAGARHFNGYINEIIIFNRTLKDYERQSVEDYLSLKWSAK